MKIKLLSSVLIVTMCCFYQIQLSYALMSSANYTIFADSINSGDVFSTGTYRLENTVGESPVGSTASSSYVINGGYQAMDQKSLRLALSGTSASLGNLTSASVSSASILATITTDCDTGYALAMSSVSGAGLTAVAGGT